VRKSRETCWTLIRGAAKGRDTDRNELVRHYRPAVLAYLRARWKGSPLLGEAEDAVQEVFLDLLRPEGALSRLEPERRGGFRPYLYGVIRIVALRFEERGRRRKDAAPGGGSWPDTPALDETSVSEAFDRAWASSVLSQAAERQMRRAREIGDAAERRVELLRLRFTEDTPVREIARLWGEEPARVHHEYAKARREFRSALLEVVAELHPGAPRQVESECARLLDFFL
jgi:RNA polymerase sigma-70 factor (ECF subfamily)